MAHQPPTARRAFSRDEYQVRRLDGEDWKRVFSYGGISIPDAEGRTILVALTITDITERKQAEERSRILFETISDAVLINELAADGSVGRFLEVNDWYCRRLGYTREEMLMMTPSDVDDPSSGVCAANVGAQLREKSEAIFDQILIARDGTRIPARIHACLFTLRGRPSVIASVRDISRDRRTEQALLQSEQRLIQAVNVAQLGIFEFEHSTRTLQCSPAFLAIYGFGESEEVTLETIMDRVLPEERPAVYAALRESIDPKGAGLYQQEHRVMHPDGLRWVLVRAETFFEGKGDARHRVRTVGAVVDTTAQKIAELELHASRQQLRTALDAARLGIWSREMGDSALTCDDLTRSIFGWKADEILTVENLISRIVPEDRSHFAERRNSLLSDQEDSDASVEYRVQRPDESIRWVSVRRSVVRDNSGRPTRLIGVVQDITGRKQAEHERHVLEQQFLYAQKMEAVGRLAGGIAHDFNNLLMVIRSYAEMMEECLPPQDALHKNTRAIMKAADRAAGLTGQMLAFSRKQVLSPVALNLDTTVAESAKMLQRLIGENIELQRKPAQDIWTVRADPDQIAQVLMNLSVNARDAMPEGGTLTIETRNATLDKNFVAKYPYILPGDYVVLSVADTGTGIPKALQERIFEPFFTTKGVGKGTGLGLSTVYGIVKQSGGYLHLDSEPGHGACFTIYLPRVLEHASGAETSKTEGLPRGTETLLVVEDEDALRESILVFLRSLGYTILSANSGQRAVTIASQFEQPIHLMLTDVVMPKMNGRELSEILGTMRPDMKTIFMSGYTEDLIVRHVVQEDGVAFLQKPFSLSMLARKVRDVLASPAANH